jgi:hypothetical protein
MLDCSDVIDTLPFSEFVDYSKVAVFASISRVTEIHFLLRSIPDSDLHFMQRQGSFLLLQYHRDRRIMKVPTSYLNSERL